MRSIAEWSERGTANAKVATVLGSIPASLRHSEIWGASDDAALNKYLQKTNNYRTIAKGQIAGKESTETVS